MNIEISKIVVIESHSGPDKILIYTRNLPNGIYPFDKTGTLEMDVGKGRGLDYVRQVFQMEPEFVKTGR